MEDLIELVKLMTKREMRTAAKLCKPEHRAYESKLEAFYDLLQRGTFKNEEELARSLCGLGKQASAYQQLRSALRSRILGSVLMFDPEKALAKTWGQSQQECYQDWIITKMLFGKQHFTAALLMSRKLLKLARQFEFTDIRMGILKALASFYGVVECNRQKYEHYQSEFKEAQQLWQEENRAEDEYLELSIASAKAEGGPEAMQARVRAVYRTIAPVLDIYASYRLHLYGRLLEVSEYTIVNHYEGTLEVCERAIAFFEAKRYNASMPLQHFYYQKAVCQLQLRRLPAALSAAERSLALAEPFSSHWFQLQALFVILHLHAGNYPIALAQAEATMARPEYKALPRDVQEVWRIKQAYFYFLHRAGQWGMPEPGGSRSVRDVNVIVKLSKESQATDIHLLLLELLLETEAGNYRRLIDRTEDIEEYRRRYLGGKDLRRCNHFLKMLLQLPKNNFDRAEVEHAVQCDAHALKSLPIEQASQAPTTEIVPYEVLWAAVLGCLKIRERQD